MLTTMKRLPIGLAALLLSLSLSAAAQSGTYSNMNTYSIPTPSSYPEGITSGPDGALWFINTSFGLGIGSSVGSAPACALGFSASFSGTTLALNFDLGIDTPAGFNVLLKNSTGATIGDLLAKAIPPAIPPHAFGIEWDSFPNLGEVTVQSVLSSGPGQPICSEWATVNTAP
jgi:hypothetical protein